MDFCSFLICYALCDEPAAVDGKNHLSPPIDMIKKTINVESSFSRDEPGYIKTLKTMAGNREVCVSMDLIKEIMSLPKSSVFLSPKNAERSNRHNRQLCPL